MYARAAIKTNTLSRNGAYGIVMRGVQKCTCSGASLRSRNSAPLCCINLDTATDIACGSGGFLVASFDKMMKSAEELGVDYSTIRESLYGFDTNPTVWALAALNMFFRGDGTSHIENASCFDSDSRNSVKGQFTKALLNPPFSQKCAGQRICSPMRDSEK